MSASRSTGPGRTLRRTRNQRPGAIERNTGRRGGRPPPPHPHRRASVQKWWSILFGAVLLASLGLFIYAPIRGWWLPPDYSSYGPEIDRLFYLILAITG